MQEELNEFDIRDIVDIDGFKYVNNRSREVQLAKELDNIMPSEMLKYNYENSFLSYDKVIYNLQKKFENPKKLKLENYEITNNGILMKRNEEIGWFNFGSSIVLVFSVDRNKNVDFKFKAGDKVKIGQGLFSLTDKL